MEKLCGRVRAEDAAALEALVKPVRDRASAAAQDFLQLHSGPVPEPPPPQQQQQRASLASSSSHGDNNNDDNVQEEPVSGRQTQLHLPEIPAEESAMESWENLEEVCTSDQCLHAVLVTDAQLHSTVYMDLGICYFTLRQLVEPLDPHKKIK